MKSRKKRNQKLKRMERTALGTLIRKMREWPARQTNVAVDGLRLLDVAIHITDAGNGHFTFMVSDAAVYRHRARLISEGQFDEADGWLAGRRAYVEFTTIEQALTILDSDPDANVAALLRTADCDAVASATA